MEWKSAGASERLHELLSQKIATSAFRFQGGKEGFPGTTLHIEREEVIECKSQSIQFLGLCRSQTRLSKGLDECSCSHEGLLLLHPQFHLQIRRSYREVVQASGQ